MDGRLEAVITGNYFKVYMSKFFKFAQKKRVISVLISDHIKQLRVSFCNEQENVSNGKPVSSLPFTMLFLNILL